MDSQLCIVPEGALIISFFPKLSREGVGEFGGGQSSWCLEKDAGVYFNCSGKPLEDFNQGHMILQQSSEKYTEWK